MIFCIYEDRVADLTGVKLALLSINRHMPEAPVRVLCPSAPQSFVDWIQQVPQATLTTVSNLPDCGWNVKPTILLDLLDKGYKDVIWLDSDIILHGSIAPILAGLTQDQLLIGEEYAWAPHQGTRGRTEGWRLRVGRNIPRSLNSCVVRVTAAHHDLLEAWQRLLMREDYRRIQARPWNERPFYMMGDQDALSALLGSEQFSNVAVHALRRGRDIAQCFRAYGYSFSERLASLWWGLPPLIHTPGPKPWRGGSNADLYLQLSPYTAVARRYRQHLDEDTSWMSPSSVIARMLHLMALGHPAMEGLPLAAAATLHRLGVRSVIRRLLGTP